MVEDIPFLAATSSLSRENQDCFDQTRTAGGIHEGQIEPVLRVPFLENDIFVGQEDVLMKLQRLLLEQGRQNSDRSAPRLLGQGEEAGLLSLLGASA